jgi:hypothetical protein
MEKVAAGDMPVTSKKNTRKLDKTAGDMPVTRR